jgi:hypothetical protein
MSHVANLSKKKRKEVKKMNMKFREEELTPVKFETSVTVIVTEESAGSLVLSCSKIHQRLLLSDIMIYARTLAKRKSEVLALWGRGTHCNILVVEDASDYENVDDIVAGVVKILNSCAEKKLV